MKCTDMVPAMVDMVTAVDTAAEDMVAAVLAVALL